MTKSYNKAACEFAQIVYEKWQRDAYGLHACESDYKIEDVEKRKLELDILKFGFDCKTSKAIYSIK